ncbi:flagellar basal-body rod protein FlgB [Paucimonas lemoignei]|uniref:Flagellar basal body rod protein FlgB n=1 Tax=Paucimonas lemoignei TaxID=29443 RepID=A0A4R3HX35_PAULE|nr:flagellar basal body protein [Paucimonas lemoignei]TCS37718.1 flagellar basal-body rod protein FlgB [Paucimonas lemoignei]
MMIEALASSGYQLLKAALDAASMRHQVTATNIANSNTENYQPLRVSFEDQLRQELAGSPNSLRPDIASRVSPRIEADPNAGTGVSVDQEMVRMSQNFIHYQALLKALNGKLELTNLAINDGRR